ncbi:hypothetical protein COB55_02950 [Candidatus Wolfebacteria bacterium]|nr:MAG: hypothetical protein COB55_02950 [Candidatus Wolfebacteria bacterium]
MKGIVGFSLGMLGVFAFAIVSASIASPEIDRKGEMDRYETKRKELISLFKKVEGDVVVFESQVYSTSSNDVWFKDLFGISYVFPEDSFEELPEIGRVITLIYLDLKGSLRIHWRYVDTKKIITSPLTPREEKLSDIVLGLFNENIKLKAGLIEAK